MANDTTTTQFALGSRYAGAIIESPCYVEPLIDGFRAALIFDENRGKAVSMAGHTIVNAYPVIEEFSRAGLLENVVLDGEFTAYPNLAVSELMLQEKILPDVYGLQFHAYDIMTIHQWNEKMCEMPLHFRKSVLAEVTIVGNLGRTLFTPCEFTDGIAEREMARRKFMSRGERGVVYKDIEAPYPFGPTTDWLIDR